MGGDETWAEEILSKLKERQFNLPDDEFTELDMSSFADKLVLSVIKEMRAWGLNQACVILIDTHKEVPPEDVVLIAARKIGKLALEVME